MSTRYVRSAPSHGPSHTCPATARPSVRRRRSPPRRGDPRPRPPPSRGSSRPGRRRGCPPWACSYARPAGVHPLPVRAAAAAGLGDLDGNVRVGFFIPQFLQGPSRGLTPVNTGLTLIPQALVLAVLLPMSGLLYDR